MEKLLADQTYHQERARHLEDELLYFQEEYNKLRHQHGDSLLSRSADIRGKVISTVDRELAIIRQGQGNGSSPCLSVKNLIHSIEKQVKTSSTPPMSPMSPTSIAGMSMGSRRNSTDSIVSTTSSILSDASPKHPLDRRSSVPNELKGVLKKTPESKDRTPIRHTMADIIYDSVPVTDDAKVTSPMNGKGEDSPVKKPSILKTSILKEPCKLVLRRGSL